MRMYIGFVLGLVVGFVLGWTAQMSNDINEKNRGRPWAPELVEQRLAIFLSCVVYIRLLKV